MGQIDLRVLLVSSGSGSRGGGEIYLSFLAEGLCELGCQVSAIVPDAENMNELSEELSKFGQVTRLPYRATYQRRSRVVGAFFDKDQQARLAAEFREQSPDIVHLNQQVAEDAADLVKAAAGSGLPWVSTIHVARSAAELEAKFGTVRDRIAMHLLRKAGGDYIAVSQASQKQLESRMGFGDWRLHVVRNGVPAPSPDAYVRAREVARADWKVGGDDIVVGVVGRIEAQKNPLSMVEYTARVGKTESKLKFVWIGDGSLRTSMEALAATKGTGLSWTIDGWRSDAATRMAGFDIFVLPSRFEGLPLAILEAMHAGLAVVAARTDGIVEAVRQGDTGLLCDNEADWPIAIAKLANNEELRRRLARSARAVATEEFGVNSMATATLAVYKSAIARRRHCAKSSSDIV